MSDLVPGLDIIGVFAVMLGFLASIRYLWYRQTIVRAEKGLARSTHGDRNGFLRWGILFAALGLALSLGLYVIGFSAREGYPLHLGPWMLGGFVPLSLGLGLILLHFITQKG